MIQIRGESVEMIDNQRIEGFVCMPWLKGLKGNFLEEMAEWWKSGKLQVEETVFHGIEKWPEAFAALFRGQNVGKVVIRL